VREVWDSRGIGVVVLEGRFVGSDASGGGGGERANRLRCPRQGFQKGFGGHCEEGESGSWRGAMVGGDGQES